MSLKKYFHEANGLQTDLLLKTKRLERLFNKLDPTIGRPIPIGVLNSVQVITSLAKDLELTIVVYNEAIAKLRKDRS